MVESSCLVPSIFAVAFFLLFAGALTAAIVFGVKKCPDTIDSSSGTSSSVPSPEEPIVFHHYSGEYLDFYANGKMPEFTNTLYPILYREFVFDDCRWYREALDDNGDVSLREFSTAEDSSKTTCLNLTNHGNCFTLTSADYSSFSTEGMELIMGDLPCHTIFPLLKKYIPDRKLDKCDYYVGYNGYLSPKELKVEFLLESGSNYPVMSSVLDLQGWYTKMKLYKTFNPEKPKDDTDLKPFPGVTVYDLRNGEGDCDDATYSVKDDSTHSKKLEEIRRQTFVRQMLHVPLVDPPQIVPSHVRNTVLRDPQTIPTEFDARSQWPDCSDVIGTITDQNPCSSCWAMASSGVLSDRMCISNNFKLQLSPQYMIYCGENTMGCQGAHVIPTWEQLVKYGTVSEECVPFTARNGECPTRCKNYTLIDDVTRVRAKGYTLPWGNTTESRVQAIQNEIMTNGPVMATFWVFNDFQEFFLFAHPDDVYHRTSLGEFIGGHAVRVIGWGTTPEGEDYWLAANSWGIDGGDEGFIRIRRGNNECDFEEQVIAGLVN